jgi:hypothetical protein
LFEAFISVLETKYCEIVQVALPVSCKERQSRDSSVGIAMGLRLDGWVLIPGKVKKLLFIPQRPHQLRGSPSSLSNSTEGSFSRGKEVEAWS